MKKNSVKGYMILVLLFILVSVIVFAVPTTKTKTVWISYAFTVVAFAEQIAIWNAALGKRETSKSKFLGFSVIHIGIVYLIVQIVTFAIFMIVPMFPSWSALVVCAIIFGVSGVCMVATILGWNEIERVEARVQKKGFYIKELQEEIEIFADNENDPAIKNALIQLAKRIRFSDPISNEALTDLENRILAKASELKSTASKLEIVREINLLLDERNKRCKILK